ncbi:MAG TPA: hypothetical protein VM822_01165 [Pseudolabrys sp.]|jgi:hypothetical protein|nr:hypothetical protein [Pseudolabrys sp.]
MACKFKPRFPSLTAIEDAWQREATRVAVEKARAVVSGGALPPMTPVGRLSDSEWGWIVAAVLFGWITTRSRQATSNGVGPDKYLYVNEMLNPDPWDAGAIEAILPELGNCEADWSKSLSQFSREEMIAFLGDAYNLIGKAMLARDKGEKLVTRKGPPGAAEPTEEQADWNDPVPF